MRSHTIFAALLLASACGGGRFFTTLTATPSSGPADVIACARAKLKDLGYQVVSFDEQDNRLIERKIDNSITRADPQYRRNVERIEVEAAAGADGKTALKVTGHTIGEYETHRGPTEVEERASENVNQASQAVIQSCGRD
jgi:hypothetical protein